MANVSVSTRAKTSVSVSHTGITVATPSPATWTLVDTATPTPNVLDSGSIASGGSDTIVAPAGSVTAKNSENTTLGSTTVTSGGTAQINVDDVTHTQTDGSSEVLPAGVALVCDTVPQLSIAVDDATPDYNGTLTITATATNLTPTSYTFQISDTESGISTVTQVSNVLAWTVNKVGTVTISVTATDGVDTTGSSTTVTVTDPLTYATKLADWNGKSGITLVSGKVSDIADQSGNGYDITTWTVGTRPFYETSSGKVISQSSDMRNTTSNPLNGKAAFTIFFKATKFAAPSSNQRLITFGANGYQFAIGLSSPGDMNVGEANYTRYATFTSNVINGATVAIIKNGTNPFAAYVNGVVATIISAVGTPQATIPTDNGIHLFSQNGGFKLNGLLDRIIIFDTAGLTGTQIAAITERIDAIHP